MISFFHTNIFNYDKDIRLAVANRTNTDLIPGSSDTLATSFDFVNRHNDEISFTSNDRRSQSQGQGQGQILAQGQGRRDSGMTADEINLKMLRGSVPGIPGEDYPIYATVPVTGFDCQGRVFGGKTD